MYNYIRWKNDFSSGCTTTSVRKMISPADVRLLPLEK
jgi:hypothetical protein